MAIVFREKMGTMSVKQGDRKFKIDIWNGNCLAVFTYDYKNDKGEKLRGLYMFFGDDQHVKNIIKNHGSLFGDEVSNVKINIAVNGAEKVARIMAKAGYKVTLYSKEVKK